MSRVYHLLGLHMHQPPGNLELLIKHNEWEARQIMLCYERPLKYARLYKDVARFCVGFSGILLEQFLDPGIVSRYAGIVDIPAMLDGYREATNIELAGMGYYHPVFPLIPMEDWDEQSARGKQKIVEVFGREPSVFWPPEMAFTMEMIPALVRNGYRYLVADSVHVATKESLTREQAVYTPHIAEYDGASIIVLPRDRDLSNAQESGLDPDWFANEVVRKTAAAPDPCLLTTWTDGENGGWFRQIHEEGGFWGFYYAPLMERVRSGEVPIRPVLPAEYCAFAPPRTHAEVRTGAWNIGSTSGHDFSHWAGSGSQKQALDALYTVRRRYRDMADSPGTSQRAGAREKLDQAREWILQAETSCYLFWGDAWIPKLYEHTRKAHQVLDEVGA